MTEESTTIGSLFEVDSKNGWFCSLYAPGTSVQAVLNHGSVYGTGYGLTPEDSIYEARKTMWKGL